VEQRLRGHTKAVCSLACHPKEAMFASASYDGTAKVWGGAGAVA
jgi:WD40 repeat protein